MSETAGIAVLAETYPDGVSHVWYGDYVFLVTGNRVVDGSQIKDEHVESIPSDQFEGIWRECVEAGTKHGVVMLDVDIRGLPC